MRFTGVIFLLLLMLAASAAAVYADIPAQEPAAATGEDWRFVLSGVMIIGGTAFLFFWLGRMIRNRSSK